MVVELSASALKYCPSTPRVLKYPCVIALCVSHVHDTSGGYLPFARIHDAQWRDSRLLLAPEQEETAS